MTLHISVNRYVPEAFMNTKINGSYSPSEALGKAVVCHCLDLDEKDVKRGDDKMKEPDWIISPKKGLEVTFADTDIAGDISAIEQIFRNQTKTLSEFEVIDSIRNSIRAKSVKFHNKNYEAVDSLLLFVLNLDPMPNWNLDGPAKDGVKGFIELKAKYLETRNRNTFFENLYDEYIASKFFENIYIFTLFKDNLYHLFDIRKHIEDPSNFITTIEVNNKSVLLPYCTVALDQISEPTAESDFSKIELEVVTTRIL